jgi:hypothetical protein
MGTLVFQFDGLVPWGGADSVVLVWAVVKVKTFANSEGDVRAVHLRIFDVRGGFRWSVVRALQVVVSLLRFAV